MRDVKDLKLIWIFVIMISILLFIFSGIHTSYGHGPDSKSEVLYFAIPLLLIGMFLRFKNQPMIIMALYCSFAIPLGMWVNMFLDRNSGLGKAKLYEQFIIFLIAWIFVFAIVYVLFFILRLLYAKLEHRADDMRNQ